MENLLQDLAETLGRMVKTYEGVLQTAREKQKHIISGNIDSLETVIYQERNLAEEILLFEKRRRFIMQSISLALGLSERQPTLGEVIGMIKDPHKRELKELYDAIKDIIIKVQDVNKVNTSFSKTSLEFINNFIRTICSESLNDTTYQQSGKIKEPEFERMLFEVNA